MPLEIKVKETLRKERMVAAIIFLLSLAYAVLILKVVMPHLPSIGRADYFSFHYLGNSYGEVIKNIVLHPQMVYWQFVDNPIKVQAFGLYLRGYAYLPLLAPHALLANIPFMLTKFVSDRGAQWGLNGQYGVVGSLELAFGTVATMTYLVHFLKEKSKIIIIVLSLMILAVGLMSNVQKEHSWLGAILTRQTWGSTAQYDGLNHLIGLIPENASVATQDRILPHLSARRHIYLYMCPICSNPDVSVDYILLDTRFGAGFAPPEVSHEVVTNLIASLSSQGHPPWVLSPANYRMIAHDGTAYLYKLESAK